MNFISEPLPSQQPLAEALVSDYAAVQQLYTSDARLDSSWVNRADWLRRTEGTRVKRKAVVERLRRYNALHNPSPEVSAALDLLEKPETYVVTGGQQSGLFTGPMLVIYKAITVIQAAAHASRKLNRPVVPVFWIAGEDHDWEEANHAYVLTRELEVNRIRVHKNDDRRSQVGQTEVSQDAWNGVIQKLTDVLQDSEHKTELLQSLRDAAAESNTLTGFFAKLLGKWFGQYGLILLDSSDKELREVEQPVFEQMILNNDELGRAYRESADQMESLGFGAQAEVAEDGANLFYIHEGERLLLFKREGRFEDRKGLVSFSRDELLEEVRLHPDRFSNNVLTRPLMQDSILPVLGTVLGAGEIAYWGLTGRAFAALGLQMPLLLPRMSFTLTDATIQKYMAKYELSFGDVKEGLAEKREAWLAGQVEMDVDHRFDEVIQAFEALYEPLIEEIGTVRRGLLKLGAANKEKIKEQIEFLRKRTQGALEEAHETALKQWERIGVTLFPNDKPQERVLNVFYYLNKYGHGLIHDLLQIPYEITGGHRIVEM
ncbi:bacillithiol biosynthesis cysteine-adding enzyme BshC [Paenibacillus sp. YPG26]|uniref:bacillithiol biosynthesis cysteine-adding enzyme BshC n=1 Tax=Paenibacillus sp. YPG26 TaxID=2878915 RepID=UPI00203B3BCB|nr:bacillithiol biosynthesis cysteine-adding enzyme BshC [Paenibacillus sp. YPG26]USB34493.1 bacillithiol biosynthesis cysteine-adding enzyme BshC [Paenibacillus sp. YPG26]